MLIFVTRKGSRHFGSQFSAIHLNLSVFWSKKGADVNCQDNNGETPLLQAVAHGKIEIVSFLLENGADANFRSGFESQTPLECAIARGYEGCVKILLDKGADVNLRDEKGRTPLTFVCALLADAGDDKTRYSPVELLLVEHGGIVLIRNFLKFSLYSSFLHFQILLLVIYVPMLHAHKLIHSRNVKTKNV
jgi:ankyrin repeat protein